MIGNASTLTHAAEFLLYELLAKRESALGAPYLLHLTNDNLKIDRDFGEAVKAIPNLDLDEAL